MGILLLVGKGIALEVGRHIDASVVRIDDATLAGFLSDIGGSGQRADGCVSAGSWPCLLASVRMLNLFGTLVTESCEFLLPAESQAGDPIRFAASGDLRWLYGDFQRGELCLAPRPGSDFILNVDAGSAEEGLSVCQKVMEDRIVFRLGWDEADRSAQRAITRAMLELAIPRKAFFSKGAAAPDVAASLRRDIGMFPNAGLLLAAFMDNQDDRLNLIACFTHDAAPLRRYASCPSGGS